jgi:HEAT repeat protein
MTADLTRASAVVEALSAAWTVFNLYPDPASQGAFQRVADTLRRAIGDQDLSLEVGPSGFLLGGEDVPVARNAADRLVKQCFVHNMEVLACSPGPSDNDIVSFLRILSQEEEDLRDEGGIGAVLAKEAVSSFTVVARALLSSMSEPIEAVVERDPGVQEVMAGAADPEAFASALVAEANGDPQLLGKLFHEKYGRVFTSVASDDVAGRETVVTVFVDAFFFLDEAFQVAVLGPFLADVEQNAHRVFLDQFAGNDLAALAPQLDSRGFSLLLDYARIATDQTDQRPEELLGLLQSKEAVRSPRELIAARVQERLADLEGELPQREAVASLRNQFPDSARFFYDTLDTFRGLLAVEERDDRFRRLMRVLTGKIGASIRRGRFRRAELWIRAAIDHPTYPAERASEIADAIEQAGAPDVLEVLIAQLAEDEESPPAQRLVATLAPGHIGELIDMMASEEDRVRRRIYLDILGRESARDSQPVIDRLDDPRWFVVRNLAVVLGRSGNHACLPALRSLVNHADHRVRAEALRALGILDSVGVDYFSDAMQDSHENVRQAAIALLGLRETTDADSILIEGLGSPTLDTDEKQRIIRVLADRPSADARQALDELANKRFTFSTKTRLLRSAAREALGSR